ncbi:PH domain-containing protein [Streptomyces sp. NPDC050617]|uniref:PH domain-containing protein n=1 Tax=Streptomyces sp. NPDC050617 TaxID=3154628 RepID=UPI00342CD67E
MTSPDHAPKPSDDQREPAYAERCYRSPAAIGAGVLLLALGAWLGIDAVVRGSGRTPWLAVAGLVFLVPLVAAYTVRPAVWAGQDRIRVRNPFRTITLPWASVEGVRAGYSSEIFAGGAKYQMWSIPVSLRARKQASRRQVRASLDDTSQQTSPHAPAGGKSLRAPADQAIDEIRELSERNAGRESAQGSPQVKWAYEVIAPAAVGFVALVIVYLVG